MLMLIFGLGTLLTPRTDTLSAIICRVRLRTDTRLNVANGAAAPVRPCARGIRASMHSTSAPYVFLDGSIFQSLNESEARLKG